MLFLAQRYNALSIERCKGVEVVFKQKAGQTALHRGAKMFLFCPQIQSPEVTNGPVQKQFTYKHLPPGLLALSIQF